jgi:hypothetical protein
MSNASAFNRDANRVPIVQNGLMVKKEYTASGTGTIVVPLFTVTGTVLVNALYGVVTNTLAANHRVGAFRVNDQTAQVQITSATGPTMDAAPIGSIIVADVLAATAASFKSSAAGAVLQPAVVQQALFTPNMITKKVGALTQIEYRFTSSTNPTTGSFTFYCGFIPLSEDGDVVAV